MKAIGRMRLSCGIAALTVAVGLWTERSDAQTTQSWANAAGGLFSEAGNWSTATPGTNEAAVFDLNAAYTVTFDGNVTNMQAQVRDGQVRYDLESRAYMLIDMNADASFNVGNKAGSAAALVLNGGNVSVYDAGIGNTTNASGTLILTNNAYLAGVRNTSSGTFVVGGAGGTGIVTVADGTLYTGRRYIFIGNMGGNGVVTLSGTNATLVYDELFLSRNTSSTGPRWTYGQLVIERGATVRQHSVKAVRQVYLGFSRDALIVVRGPGSTFNTGTIEVGYSPSRGTLLIEDGGIVTSTIARVAGSSDSATGTVVVTGTGSDWVVKDLILAGFNETNVTRKSEALLTIANGGRVSATNSFTILPRGTVCGDGTLRVTPSTKSAVNRGGLVTPGTQTNPAALGTLTVEGNYVQEIAVTGVTAFVGTLRVRVGAAGSDKLVVTNNITLDGKLDLVAFNSPTLVYGATFDILDWGGTLTGAFSETNGFVPGSNLWWNFSKLYTDGTISVTGPPRGTSFSIR